MTTVLRERLRGELPYIAFLVGMAALMLFLLSRTYGFRSEQTALMPRLVIVVSLVAIALDLVFTLFPSVLPSALATEADESAGFQNREINVFGVTKQFAWLLGYLLVINLVGFFTTTFAFVFLYIMVHGERLSRGRRAGSALAWSSGIIVFLYLLFVELLRVSSVFRFGFLP